MSVKLCPACTRDQDPRGWSACFYCRELNQQWVPSPQIPQHVAGLSRAGADHVAALRCGSPDVDVTWLALDGAVTMYREAEDEQAVAARDLSVTHVDRVMLRLIRVLDDANAGRDAPHVKGWRALAREAIQLGAAVVDEEVSA